MANENESSDLVLASKILPDVQDQQQVKKPRKFRVVLLNDDYTPMEFVVWLLMTVFHHPQEEAARLMMMVHQTGRGVCGVYTHDVARTKMFQVQALAEKHEHPLQAVLEAVEPQENE